MSNLNRKTELMEKCRYTGFGTKIIRRPLYNHEPTLGEAGRNPIENWYSFHREGQKEPLTVRSGSFQILQDEQVLDHALAFEEASDGNLTIKQAGTWSNGGVVFVELASDNLFLIGGRGDDAIQASYILVNGHDGSRAFSGSPFTKRLFCQNQLPALFNRQRNLGFRVLHRHISDHMQNVEDAVRNFGECINKARIMFEKLADSPAPSRDVLRHWLTNQYMQDYQPPVENLEALNRYNRRSAEAINNMLVTFDQESSMFGSTKWIMFNSYTKWLQHESGRLTDSNRRHQRNVIGIGATRSCQAANAAMELIAA